MHMSDDSHTHIALDSERLERAIAARGFASVKEFAEAIGLHRNTVGNYLTGKTSLPGGLARILSALDLEPGDVLTVEPRPRRVAGLAVTSLVETLHEALPGAAFVLFGSRARGTAKHFSDYDLGVWETEKLELASYSGLLDMVEEWNASSLHTAQLVDLTRATGSLLRSIAPDVVFLAGSYTAWCDLLRKAGLRIHE